MLLQLQRVRVARPVGLVLRTDASALHLSVLQVHQRNVYGLSASKLDVHSWHLSSAEYSRAHPPSYVA